MANDLTRRPWLIDTAGLVKKGISHCTGFVFQQYINGAASQAIIQDSRGRTICVLNGIASGTPVGEAWFTDEDIYDMTVTAIDSGVVKAIIK